MNIGNRWLLLLAIAASAAAGAALAATSRRRHHRDEGKVEHESAIKSWENEGGNPAPNAAPLSNGPSIGETSYRPFLGYRGPGFDANRWTDASAARRTQACGRS